MTCSRPCTYHGPLSLTDKCPYPIAERSPHPQEVVKRAPAQAANDLIWLPVQYLRPLAHLCIHALSGSCLWLSSYCLPHCLAGPCIPQRLCLCQSTVEMADAASWHICWAHNSLCHGPPSGSTIVCLHSCLSCFTFWASGFWCMPIPYVMALMASRGRLGYDKRHCVINRGAESS